MKGRVETEIAISLACRAFAVFANCGQLTGKREVIPREGLPTNPPESVRILCNAYGL
jgi:hypothetical protein